MALLLSVWTLSPTVIDSRAHAIPVSSGHPKVSDIWHAFFQMLPLSSSSLQFVQFVDATKLI